MTLIALIRPPSPNLQDGELTHLERTPINSALAAEQHAHYVEALREAGAGIVEVPAAPELPDAVFIEDTALVLGSLVVIARSRAESRRAELPAVVEVLSQYCHLANPPPAAYFDGGDILAVGRTVYIGRSTRTNQAAIDYLTTLLRTYHYEVVPVPVSRCLHLKSGVTCLGNNTVLINPQWIARESFAKHVQIDVDLDEPQGANALLAGGQLLMSSSYPRTAKRVESHGFLPRMIDISEFHRAEGGLTCLSILFTAARDSRVSARVRSRL